MEKNEIVLISDGRSGNIYRYAIFGNVMVSSHEKAEKLLRNFGLIEEDESIIISQTNARQVTGYSQSSYVGWVRSG